MYVDPSAEETFGPRINRTSKQLASNLESLHNRMGAEQTRKQQRLAELTHSVRAQEREELTFVPKTNAMPVGYQPQSRVPLAERQNVRPASEQPLPDPELTGKPAINAASAEMAEESRGAVEAARALRKRVRDLWNTHAEGNTMSVAGVTGALSEVGLVGPTAPPAIIAKFLAALGMDPADANRRYVAYDRFSKVFHAVLSKASAAGSHAASPRQTRQVSAPESQRPMPGSRQPSRSSSVSGYSERENSVTAHPEPKRQPTEVAKRSTSVAASSSRPVPDVHKRLSESQSAPTTRKSASRSSIERDGVPQPFKATPMPREVSPPQSHEPPMTELHKKTIQRERELAAKRKAKARADEVTEADREAAECTFAPDRAAIHGDGPTDGMTSHYGTSSAEGRHGNPPGFEAAIQRMAEARKRHTPGFEDSLRGVQEQPSSSTGERPRSTIVKPFNLQGKVERPKPLLYVDVDMPNGKQGRIGVFPGDRPDLLAANFCTTYGLGGEMPARLTALLEDRIKHQQAKEEKQLHQPHSYSSPKHQPKQKRSTSSILRTPQLPRHVAEDHGLTAPAVHTPPSRHTREAPRVISPSLYSYGGYGDEAQQPRDQTSVSPRSVWM